MNHFIFLLEMIGTFAFASSGALAAIEKNNDIFGVIFIGIVSALGGGVIRDIVIGNTPPVMFSDYTYVVVAITSAIIMFILIALAYEKVKKIRKYMDELINVLDAIGLGVFTIVGVNTGIEYNYTLNPVLIIFLAMITGVGGGMLRDILIQEIPFIFKKRIYALASICGGLVYYILILNRVNHVFSTLVGILLVFLIRMLATIFKINLPRALNSMERIEK